MTISFEHLHNITGGRIGVFDAPCPLCGPDRRSPVNRRREVFRAWCDSPGLITYRCARCEVCGYVHDGRPPDLQRNHVGKLPTRSVEESNRSEFPLQIWSETIDAPDTLTEKYLHLRGLALPERHEEVIRFHPSCHFGKGARHPCMVALFRDIHTNEPKAIHRTALTPEGTKIDRKVMGPKAGCAIKLTPDEYVEQGLTIAEGIETALAGMALNFRPAWALGDAFAVAKFPVLSGIECLTILVDNDASGTGQETALDCSQLWTRAGREVFRVVPTTVDTDMADVIRGVAA